MSMNQTSASSARGRAERPSKLSLRALAQNLIVRAQRWLNKLVSLRYARVAMIFVAGLVAALVWDSYGGDARRAVAGWSPHLGWIAPAAASERMRSMEVALATARQSLSKLATEMSRLEVQADAPQRRSTR